jgi:TRAP-type C4-dicarboxylate transport system substrate-binding protein
MCASEQASIEDWQGSQVRASGLAQTEQLSALDASPVSMEYTEVYEALQRNTVDCTLTAALPAGASGVAEVASNVGYTGDVSFARGPGGAFAGSAWDTWPLAVQQLVFDSMMDEFAESRRVDLDGTHIVVETVQEQGGSFTEVDDEIQQALLETSEGLVDDEVAAGTLPEGATETINETITRWTETVRELGYEDEGGFEDFTDWYEKGDIELFDAISQHYFEEVMLPHRPN